jgi:hypothetical protein
MKNSITQEDINAIVEASEFKVASGLFGKTTVVTAKLPNGFTITEASSCVDPDNYNLEIGRNLAMKKIVDKIWELEGYRLQCELAPVTPFNPETKESE